MPLRDHFHPPLVVRRHWHGFHNAWATFLASALNQHLPEGYFAEPNVQFTIPFTMRTDIVEVAVYGAEAGPTLVGAIELVSPSNKDRAQHRDAFVAKCEAYLQQGVGLVVVDIVTNRTANLHHELLSRLGADEMNGNGDELYASAYRPVGRGEEANLDIWHESLRIGNELPVMPLYLRGGICLQVELDATYERTCREQRIS